MLVSSAPLHALTSAALAYTDMLEAYSPTTTSSDSIPAAGLWAMLPLPVEDRPTPLEEYDDFTSNPACTDRSPIVGVRRGGTELPATTGPNMNQHTNTTVTVDVIAEPNQSLYGLCLTREAVAGCLRSELSFSTHLDGTFTEYAPIRTVVDTGAAWSAIRLDEVVRGLTASNLPTSRLAFEETSLSFTGISGTRLKCLGWIILRLQLGQLVINTKAFVFPHMHEPMLLGLNTLTAANLCVDVGRMGMYPSPLGELPPGAVPLFVDNPTREPSPVVSQDHPDSGFYTTATRDHLLYARDGQVCAQLPCSSSPKEFHKRGGNKNATSQLSKMAEPISPPRDEELEEEDRTSTLLAVTCTGTFTPDSPHLLGEHRAERLQAVDTLYSTGCLQRPDDHLSSVRTLEDTVFDPGDTRALHLYFVEDVPGVNRTLEVAPSAPFRAAFPELGTNTTVEVVSYHQSAQKVGQYRLHNSSDRQVVVPAGTAFGSAIGASLADSNLFHLQHHPDWVNAMLDDSGYRFEVPPTVVSPHSLAQALMTAAVSTSPEIWTQPKPPAVFPPDENPDPDSIMAEFEGIGATTVEFEYIEDQNYESLPFDRGGKPRNAQDLIDGLGLNLDDAVDASLPECPPLSAEDRQRLVDVCVEQGAVWSRHAKVPTPAKHPWARCEINTGDAKPVAQRPYPIPQKYLGAVRAEIDSLLKAGLIEPGFGNWASPVICIVKKDSNPNEVGGSLRIKLAVDYRMLNAHTVVDCAQLGDQADVLDCFHGRPHLTLADAAGGFYQFQIATEADRQKTGFILPSSCGGTLFQWRVAPYGLTNMPAIYSRAMQHVLRGMVDMDLGHAVDDHNEIIDPDNAYLGKGSAPTWVDDITMASGGASPGYGIRGHIELLRRVFQRLIIAGMTLKPSKTDILRRRLKVLGFEITREGLRPQADKVEAIRDIPRPGSPHEVLKFLGVINFQRRFIPAIGHIAHPLYELLKGLQSSELKARRRPTMGKNPKPPKPFLWTEECESAFTQLKQILCDDCLNSHPDLDDPDAELVMMTDASTKAAGAVLMQWQRAQPWDTLTAGSETTEDGFDAVVTERLAKGYTLKTLGFFSKTFAHAQVNWAIFDKEAASIVMALTNWHRLIAGRPITVYTDNTVAASILTNTKFTRPPRLQRWGVVLGTYLPLLRIAYRKGELNPVADCLSRYPDDINYRPDPSHFAEAPDDLYDHILSLTFNGRRFLLSEAKVDVTIKQIWADLGEIEDTPTEKPLPRPDLPNQTKLSDLETIPEEDSSSGMQEETDPVAHATDTPNEGHFLPVTDDERETVYNLKTHPDHPHADLNVLLSQFKTGWEADDAVFKEERQRADRHLSHWAQYVQAFRATYDRAPILYDLYCGGGGFGRGAARAGFTVVGVDVRDRSHAYGRKGLARNLSNQFLREEISAMHYLKMDIETDEFWSHLEQTGSLPGYPPPDIIHASPPCSPHSALAALPNTTPKPRSSLKWLGKQLLRYQGAAEHLLHKHVPFSIENVEGAHAVAAELKLPISLLCGTMFGLRVFRHRLFITEPRPLEVELICNHNGKAVGSNSINRTGLSTDYSEDALSNMRGPYSWYHPSRGTRDELHHAMGMEPGAMGSYRDLTLSLPPDYGEYVSSQLLAMALRENLGMPTISYNAAQTRIVLGEMLASWADTGFRPSSQQTVQPSPESASYAEEIAALKIQNRYRAERRYDTLQVSASSRTRLRARTRRLSRGPSSERPAEVLHRLAPHLLAPLDENPEEPGNDPAETGADPEDTAPEPETIAEDLEAADTAQQPRPGRHRHTPLQPTDHQEDDGTPPHWVGPWTMTLEAQLLDPECRLIYESLTASAADAADWKPPRVRKARRHRARFCMHAGRIHALTVDGTRVLVPAHIRYDLTSVSHRTLDLGGHRGVSKLYDHLSRRYYWDGLLSDCEEVVMRCEVCRVRDLTHKLHPRFVAMPDPPHPFHTIYLDYKDVPGSMDGHKNAILVVVDGLTRFVIAEPVGPKNAENTLSALINRVFTVHSLPSIIRSDNGSEFDNELSASFTLYAGYRHIKILPYNACANGKAESSVKRIQELLIKHCTLLANWRETLPMLCFALNCSTHSSTEASPFYSLFGREPIMIPELEDPSGYRATYSGPDFLRNAVERFRTAWDAIRSSSDALRTSVIKRGERSRQHWDRSTNQDGCAGIHVGDWVLLKHGSDAHAKIRRKHGYPAYRRFRVTRIIPEAHALELDIRNLNIHPVVSVRQCKRAPEEWYLFNDGSLASGRYDGPLTLPAARGNPHEIGGRQRGQEPEEEPDSHQDSCIYPVEWILEAFHSKRRWWYRVVWLGYPTATWESHEDLEASAGETVLEWMSAARERFQAKFRRRRELGEASDYNPVDSSVRDRDSDEDDEIPPFEEWEPHAAGIEPEMPVDLPEEPEAAPAVDTSTLGEVPTTELRTSNNREQRGLAIEVDTLPDYTTNDRMRRRLQRSQRINTLTEVNLDRTIVSPLYRRIAALFVPSLLT